MIFIKLLTLMLISLSCFAAQVDIADDAPTDSVQNAPADVVSAQEGSSLENMVQEAQENASSDSGAASKAEENSAAPAQSTQEDSAQQQENLSSPQNQNAPETPVAQEPVIEHHMEPVVASVEAPAEKPADAPVQQPPQDLPEDGIDTLDVQGGGNWLLKRGWWEQAEKRYEKIKALVNQIMDVRMSFFAKRAELDRNVLDPFYAQVGLDQGKIEETITYLLDEMEQERKKDGTLSPEERSFLDVLAIQKKSLEQLMLDVQAISKLDSSIDEAIAALNDQINRARGYENQAWKNFKDISRELSDEKAKELYYAIDTFYANIGDIYHYIQNDLSQHFMQLVDIGVKQIEQIKTTMQTLKEKGVDLKRQAQRIAEQEEAAERGQSKEELEKLAREKAAKKAEEERGFFGKIWAYIAGFFSGIFSGMVNFFSNLF